MFIEDIFKHIFQNTVVVLFPSFFVMHCAIAVIINHTYTGLLTFLTWYRHSNKTNLILSCLSYCIMHLAAYQLILQVLHTITDFIRMTAVIYLITNLLLYFMYCWKFMCDIHTHKSLYDSPPPNEII